jgi:DNA-binding MarR family transcriptional regulator
MSTAADSPLADRLGYLLKHAREALAARTGPALAPLGIDGRQLAVLITLDTTAPLSQQDAALRLGVDRTTMVALIDALEAAGLVARAPHPDDRRKNTVSITARGRDVLDRGTRASELAEAEFLAELTENEAWQLKSLLRTLIWPDSAAVRARRRGRDRTSS